MRKRKRKRHVEGTTLAGVVLVAAALAAIILLVNMAGGTTGADPNIPKSCRTVPASRSPIITLPPDEPHGSAPLSSPEMSPSGDEPAIAVPAPGGTSTPVTDSVAQAGTDIHAWYADNAIKVERQWRRQEMVDRINRYLAGSPMASLGECMVANAERVGWNPTTGEGPEPRLCAAVAQAESTLGRVCPSYQPFGMGCSYGSWEQGIAAWFDNLVGHPSWAPWHTGYDIQNAPAYCVLDDKVTPNPVYGPNVTGQVNAI